MNSILIKQLNWRYAVKKFDKKKKISEEDWETLEEVLRLTPSSYGLQPWKFILVQTPALRKKLLAASWNQAQIEDCSHLLVITHLTRVSPDYVKKHFQKVSEVQGATEESLQGYQKFILDILQGVGQAGIKNLPEWTARQCYIAMGEFMTAAAVLGIDVCPLEGLEVDRYDEILDLGKTDYATLAVLTAGYRSAEDQNQHKKKVRFERAQILEKI